MRPATRRALRRWFWLAASFFVVFVTLCNRWVINSTDSYLYADWAFLPNNEVGLVLGTSAYTDDGENSPFFDGRIRAAAELYQLGKVKRLVVSGANPDASYNEPRKMYQALIKLGVPATAIKMDFAGVRTLDSVLRAQAVWGQTRYTVITQKFHAYRAVFLGRKMGMTPVAYVARIGKSGDEFGRRNPLREIFARAWAVLDLFANTQPKFDAAPEMLEPLEAAPEEPAAP